MREPGPPVRGGENHEDELGKVDLRKSTISQKRKFIAKESLGGGECHLCRGRR